MNAEMANKKIKELCDELAGCDAVCRIPEDYSFSKELGIDGMGLYFTVRRGGYSLGLDMGDGYIHYISAESFCETTSDMFLSAGRHDFAGESVKKFIGELKNKVEDARKDDRYEKTLSGVVEAVLNT